MQPEKVFRIGANTASIFCNQYGYSVNVQRRYKDADTDEWKSSSYFRLSDLPQIAALVRMATDYVAAREASADAPQSDDRSATPEPTSSGDANVSAA